MKIKKIISLILCFMLCTVCGTSASENDFLPFQDFENMGESLASPWVIYNAGAGDISIVSDKYGKCIKAVTSPKNTTRPQIFYSFTDAAYAPEGKYVFSIKLGDLTTSRTFYLKNDKTGNEPALFQIGAGGKILIPTPSAEMADYKMVENEWYSVVLEHNSALATIKCTIFGNGETFYSEGKLYDANKNFTGTNRLNFVLANPAEGESVTYIDNVHFYACPGRRAKKAVITYDDYVDIDEDAEGGKAVPSGWSATEDEGNGVTSVQTDGRGRSIKIYADGSLVFQPTHWIKVDAKQTYEADIMFDECQSLSIYPYGSGKDGVNVGGTIVQFAEGKVLVKRNGEDGAKLYEVEDFTFEDNKWYKMKMVFDIANSAFTFTLTDEEGGGITEGIEGYLNSNRKDISSFRYMVAKGKTAKGIYLDNIACYIGGSDFAVTDSSLFDRVDVLPDFEEITFEFNDDIAVSKLDEAKILINGSDNLIKDVKAQNNKLTLSLKEKLPFNMRYSLTIENLLGTGGIGANYRLDFTTAPKYTISSFALSGNKIVAGKITASANVSSLLPEGQRMSMMIILRDKETGKMVDGKAKFILAKEKVTEISVECEVPDDGKEYELSAHIWDDFLNMNTLYEPIAIR